MSTPGPSKDSATGEPAPVPVGEPSSAEPPALPPPERGADRGPALSLQRLWQWMMLVWKAVVTTATSVSAVALVIWIGVLVAGETMQRGSIVIDAIAVPKKLADDGYTSDVVAQKLRDAVRSVVKSANTAMRTPDIQLMADLPTVTIPATGLSVASIAAFIRNFLGLEGEHEVSGDFTIAKDMVWLRLRMNGKVFYSSQTEPDLGQIEKVIQAAAAATVDEAQPYLAASAAYDTDPEGAVAIADRIIARFPETDENVVWCHNLKGLFADTKSDFLAAEAEYRKAIRLDPKLAIFHDNLGEMLAEVGRIEEAIAEYRVAIGLDPKFADPHSDLGDALGELGKIDQAIAEYGVAMRLDPKLADPHTGLGNLLRGQGKIDDAVAEFYEAIRLDSKDADPHTGLGKLLKDQGKIDDAIAEYRVAVGLDPKKAGPYLDLGLALRDQGGAAPAGPDRSQKLREACEAFTRSAVLASNDADYAATIVGIDQLLTGGVHCPPR